MSRPVVPRWLDPALVVVLLAVATALRVHGLERQGLWSDELFAVLQSYQPHFHNIFPELLRDSHPPGYLSFMYFTLPLVGYEDWQVRLHALLAGIAIVYITYVLGKRFLNPETGLLAAGLVTISFQEIYYSQEARAYTLLSVTSLLNFRYFLEIFFQQQQSRRNLGWFILTGILTVYLHYAGVVFFCCEGLVALVLIIFSQERFAVLRTGSIAFLPVVAVYLPWVGVMYRHMTSIDTYWGGSVVLGWRQYEDLKEFMAGPSELYADILLYAIALSTFIALVKWFIARKRRTGTHRELFYFLILLMALMPIGVFYIKSLISQTVFENRHFLYALPLLALVVSYSIGELLTLLPATHLNRLLLVALVGVTGWYQYQNNEAWGLHRVYFKDPIREAADVVVHDTAFTAQDPHPIYMSYTGFYHYLRLHGVMQKPNDDLYTAQHYLEMAPLLANPAIHQFYYLNMGDAADYGFAQELDKHHRLLCRSVLQSLSGKVTISKYELTLPPDAPESARACAYQPAIPHSL